MLGKLPRITLPLIVGVWLFAPVVASGAEAAAAAARGAPTAPRATDLFSILSSYPTNERLSDANKEALQSLIAATLEREMEIIDENRKVLAWTNTASLVVFWVAHASVLLAFVAASLEFRHAYRLRRDGKSAGETEVTLKLESIAVKSSSLAVLLLMTALAFYFLYVKFVHPIQVIPI